ncbi:MAG TPA: hypothetical protein VJ508_16600, partial [Saprospiraceae bacterium]|nr:hypothetical protein [Saprospiraceae bacterium]
PTLSFLPLSSEKEAFLNRYFLMITETGDRLEGPPALARWCSRQKLPYEKTADEYIRTMKKYLAYRDENGLIEGIGKLKNTTGFSEIGLDQLYYSDFYAIERFGKTRLGTLLHIAKQTQNQQMIREISQFILTDVYKIIQQEHIDAVGYIPPTLKRDVQFMTVMENTLNLSLPHLHLLKIRGDIVIPQKALSRLEERIENARSTIMVYEKRKFHKVLLIDDAVGSGATMNETALKLKARAVADYVIGYAVTGSFKGFDVIQEV